MRSTSRESRSALPALTCVRFFAALWVVTSHLVVMGFMHFPAPVLWVAGDSRPAVTFFFVLSGFILAHNYSDDFNRDALRRFYVARFARIYPMLLVSLTLAAPVTAVLLISDDKTHLFEWYGIPGNPTLPLITSLLAQLLCLTAWLPFATVNQPWNGPAWSISCEVFFYLMFPLLVRFIARLTWPQRALLLIAGFCAQGLWVVAAHELLAPSRSGFLISQWPLTHLFEFVLGIAAERYCRASLAGSSQADHKGRVAAAIALVVIGLLLVGRPVEPAYYLLSPCFALLIGGLAVQKRPVWGLLSMRPLVLLGEASFSLYLIHVPLMHLAAISGMDHNSGLPLLFGLVLSSVLVFCVIERPVRATLVRRFTHRATAEHSPAITA